MYTEDEAWLVKQHVTTKITEGNETKVFMWKMLEFATENLSFFKSSVDFCSFLKVIFLSDWVTTRIYMFTKSLQTASLFSINPLTSPE